MIERLVQTPSQTVGPFFSIGLCRAPQNVIATTVPGERIRIEGAVLDGAGAPVPDAMLEVWHPAVGFGRAATGQDGRYFFDAVRAPFLNVIVFARGMLVHAFTRMYFSDEAGNAGDAVLMGVDVARRSTLVAQRTERDGKSVYGWDVRLQGEGETVFFDL
jgi:protocatechuate 3,4-dioxygenase alpha subunit